MYDVGNYIMKKITLRYIEERISYEKGITCDFRHTATYSAAN
ncbi:hypothetical protein DFP96_10125 [Listeria rocourtiae]|uniref:Uncharacterized protein n=1 Tax=Listeria rocourtiae TaxID=647910 RepID=A0A4R6ZSH6_9LIST|nr:hypothetical protein DFP96_10125 [Listeria rocourtiae]